MRQLLLTCAVVMPVAALACINDRDTLGYELHNKPDVQRALTGRFDRYPPLYYQMRISRLRGKGALTPSDYDDLAVAYGRIGQNDEALSVLAQKANLPSLTSDERYRLYANRGTFEAHKWFHDGAKASQIPLLKQAITDIKQAITINPHAHFGREGTQLEVLRWVMHQKRGPKPQDSYSLGEWLMEKIQDAKLEDSLSGLIMLGGAWESPDTALAIGEVADMKRVGLAGFAIERYRELVDHGAKPLEPTDEAVFIDLRHRDDPAKPGPDGVESTEQRFKELRKEADEWHNAKTAFMIGRLNQGKHPDTDADFWDGWTEPPLPQLPTKLPSPFSLRDLNPIFVLAIVIAGVTALAICYELIRKRRIAPAALRR